MTPSTHNTRLTELAQRAHDLVQANQPAAAGRFHRLAGETAVATLQYDAALTHFSQALDMTPDSQNELRYALLLARSTVLAHLGRRNMQEMDLISLATLANSMDDDRRRAEVAAHMATYKLDSGAFQEAISIVQLGARLAALTGAEQELSLLEQIWGQALLRQGAFAQAGIKLKSALARAAALNWRSGKADSLRILGMLALEQSEYAQARSQYEAALAIYADIDDQAGQANILNNLANVAHAQGDFSAAQAYWEAAKPINETLGDRVTLCRILVSQSAIYIDVGYDEQARQHLETALAVSREIGLRFGEALANINLALAHHDRGDLAAAQTHAQAGMALAQAMGSRRLEGYALAALGKVLSRQGNLKAAADHYWQALALWEELAQPGLAVEARAGLAQVALAQQNQATAVGHVESLIDHLANGAGVDGTDAPFDIYMNCFRVLDAAQDARAASWLHTARDLLQTRAAAILDEAMRASFVQKVTTQHPELAG